jgi:hypothetical protein
MKTALWKIFFGGASCQRTYGATSKKIWGCPKYFQNADFVDFALQNQQNRRSGKYSLAA